METKNDTKIASPISFQPMSKRFMVWDDEANDWICVPGTERDVWSLLDLITHRSGLMKHKFHMQIVQSTNLFDKNGEEIFEGSILQEPDGSVSVVEYDSDEAMFRTRTKNILDDMSCGGDYFELIGHILTNPELLEEKNV